MQRIYLDNAATSWPKPAEVYDAVDRWQRENGAPFGRGVYDSASATDRLVHDARRAVAEVLGIDDPSRIVFTLNGTDALHLAIQGLIKPGDHVVTTVVEHNSVLRPLRQLESRGVATAHVGCDGNGVVAAGDVIKALNSKTKFVVVAHASNVTGALQPVAEIGAELRKRGVTFIVDAAQTLGELPFTAEELSCDLLASPGHKGLLGPLGTGVLYVRPGIEERLGSIRIGGTGSQSSSTLQPKTMPDKFEAGNLNVPGVVGLGTGVRWLLERGIANVREHALQLTTRLLDGLLTLNGVRVLGPREASRCVGLVSLTIEGYDPQEAAAVLATSFGIEARAGLHCSPLMHKALGTDAGGGTLRLSLGPLNTAGHVDAAVAALGQLTATG
ncbi:MAG: aminotransferase class V-fold PLP-dependent enzyme [Planctomycetales bacterium]|nr:aminotransferase class V-fold PLP-dependent enzyme [Planctomycetales bacterium]MBN8628307.1 aminotransferase class V-fold PLP-dependent enzyme [Planctomycetota bacterium]